MQDCFKYNSFSLHKFIYLFRLSEDEKREYLKVLLDDEENESLASSDSEDDEWLPADDLDLEVSDNEQESDYEAEFQEDVGSDEESVNEEAAEEENERESESEEENEDEATATSQSKNYIFIAAHIFLLYLFIFYLYLTFLSVLGSNNTSFIAKDNTIWLKNAPNLHQTPSRNIIRQRAGPHRITEVLSISDTFKKIMTMEMVDIIVRCTNKKAEAVYQEYNGKHPKREPRVWKKVTRNEMYSFFGILLCAGVHNSNTDHVTVMWKKASFPLYRATKLAVESYIDCPTVAAEVVADNQPRDTTGRKVVVGACHICNKQPIRKRRKTRKSCVSCQKPVCDEHTVKITNCLECSE